MSDTEIIREQTRKIAASKVLGRSRSYARLLDYLVACSLDGRTPKELEIATEVFGKSADFDPSQDSMVRVYAHNLRQKLKQFYDGAGRDEPRQLAIPKGEYRVTVVSADAGEGTARALDGRRVRWLAGIAAPLLVLVGVAVGLSVPRGNGTGQTVFERAAAAPIWSSLLDDDLPTLVVVGDYYIFGELDEAGNIERLVRDFTVNSSKDLDELMMYRPGLADEYIDLDLTYLARSTAYALHDVLRVLYTSEKPVRIVSMSELNVAELKSNHIVYVGYVSALDKLLDFVFASSGLAVGETFDELWNKKSGKIYTSEAGMPAGYRNYRDYALYSTFPGPSGNRFVVIAGTRDAGLMHSAQVATRPAYVEAAAAELRETAADSPRAFELLYEVTGFDRTNLDAMLVYSGPLDYRRIWGGEPLSRDD
jgi:hypothetical protein